MFRPFYGKCLGSHKYQGCGRENQPIKTKRGLCPYCEQDRKQEMKGDKQVSRLRKPRKVTGEYALFEAIAASRPHVCFVTGKPVNVYKSAGKLDVWVFAHVLSKKPWVKFRLYDKNIQIMSREVHQIYDAGNEKQRKEMEIYPGWARLMELREELIQEYYSK